MVCLFRNFNFVKVVWKFLKNVLNIHRDKEITEFIEYTNISWSDFGQKGRILVRFLCKIGQIVSQILENFSQILIISTLVVLCYVMLYILCSGWLMRLLYPLQYIAIFCLLTTYPNMWSKVLLHHYRDFLPEEVSFFIASLFLRQMQCQISILSSQKA